MSGRSPSPTAACPDSLGKGAHGASHRATIFWRRAGAGEIATELLGDFTVGETYLHPWEVDPDQPRQSLGGLRGFRHYVNLSRMEGRIRALCRDFRWDRMDRVFLPGAA